MDPKASGGMQCQHTVVAEVVVEAQCQTRVNEAVSLGAELPHDPVSFTKNESSPAALKFIPTS